MHGKTTCAPAGARDELPAGWSLATVGEITLPVTTTSPSEKPDAEFQYLDISSIDNQSSLITNPKTYLGKEAPSRARQVVAENDTLFSTVRTYLKNIAMVPGILNGQIASTGFAVLRPAPLIEPKFLFHHTLTSGFLNSLGELQRGTSYPAVRDEDVRAQTIPLPPTAEQRRIVAKIEELFSELDKGMENLQQARAQLAVYRQALLKHAFEGKLTADWRKTHAAQLESAAQLLTCIRTERALATPKRQAQEQAPSTQERSAPNGLPEKWVWASVSDLGRIETGTTPPTNDPTLYGDRLPFFKPTDLEQENNVRVARTYLSERGMDHARLLPAGTTLVTCIGATIGKTGLARLECATNQQINSISPTDPIVPEFIYYQAIGPSFQDQVKTNASSTTLPIINKSKFARLPLALCSHAEQTEIVRILDQQCSAISLQEADIETNLQRAEALRQSILKKAFAGELVPQDPADEPAAALLARIRAEREAASKAPTTRKATKQGGRK